MYQINVKYFNFQNVLDSEFEKVWEITTQFNPTKPFQLTPQEQDT